MNQENKIYYNIMDSQLKNLFNNSTDAPKTILRSGKFTKTFLKWNLKKIREGLTLIYADKTKLYNPRTNRLINVKVNKRSGKILKSFSKKYPRIQGSIIAELEGDVEETFLPNNYNEGNYEGIPINTYDWWLDYINSTNITGKDVRVIIKYYDVKQAQELTNSLDLNLQQTIISLQSDFNGNFNYVLDKTISIPSNGFNKSTWKPYRLDFMYNSDYPNILAYLLSLGIKCKIIITSLVELEQIDYFQSFLDGGKVHCVLHPILKWNYSMFNNATSKTAKQRYKQNIDTIIGKEFKTKDNTLGYLEVYKSGIPEDKLNELCEKLQIKLSIEYPFFEKYKSYSSSKKPIKHFKYINTRSNHLETKISSLNKSDIDIVEYDYDELEDLKDKLILEKEYFTFNRNCFGISQINCKDIRYTTNSTYNEEVKEWYEELLKDNINIDSFSIDALKYPDLNRFLKFGTHHNGTRNFIKVLPNITDPNIGHIDIRKAFTQYEKCKYYDGFMGKITDFREINNYNQKGYYYIYIENFNNCSQKFINLNNTLKWFVTKNVYTDAELRFLKDQKCKFKVLCGAYGLNSKFSFNDTMKNNKVKVGMVGNNILTIPNYSKWVGTCAMQNFNKRINMYGDKPFFENMKTEGNNIYYDDYRQEATITYPNKTVYSKIHIAGQIIAYQRLIMIEQLLNMDYDKLLRVCVDGIYYYKHKFNYDKTIFCDKLEKMTFNNGECESYLSSIIEKVDNPLKGMKFGRPREHFKNELWLGQGGCGKTYDNLGDKGFINMCYIAPSNKLIRSVEKEYEDNNLSFSTSIYKTELKVFTLHKFLYMNYEYHLQDKYNVILLDEVSQYTERQKQEIFKLNCKVIFMGDIGYQLEPVIDYKEFKKVHYKMLEKNKTFEKDFLKWLKKEGHYEITIEGFDNYVNKTFDYRAKDCEKLKEIKLKLRDFINKGKYLDKNNKIKLRNESIQYIKDNIKSITIDDLKTNYKKTDLILCSKHEFISLYNTMFSHLEKYLIHNTGKDYANGEVHFNLLKGMKVKGKHYKNLDTDMNHGFTINSIQGETLGDNDTLYLDMREFFSDRMLYTAISRARRLDQIKILY